MLSFSSSVANKLAEKRTKVTTIKHRHYFSSRKTGVETESVTQPWHHETILFKTKILTNAHRTVKVMEFYTAITYWQEMLSNICLNWALSRWTRNSIRNMIIYKQHTRKNRWWRHQSLWQRHSLLCLKETTAHIFHEWYKPTQHTTALIWVWAKYLDTLKLFIINSALCLVFYSKSHASRCIIILIYTQISNIFWSQGHLYRNHYYNHNSGIHWTLLHEHIYICMYIWMRYI